MTKALLVVLTHPVEGRTPTSSAPGPATTWFAEACDRAEACPAAG